MNKLRLKGTENLPNRWGMTSSGTDETSRGLLYREGPHAGAQEDSHGLSETLIFFGTGCKMPWLDQASTKAPLGVGGMPLAYSSVQKASLCVWV